MFIFCRCFEEHKKLQESLEKQQDRVSSLQNMVVIVEDGVQDPGKLIEPKACSLCAFSRNGVVRYYGFV